MLISFSAIGSAPVDNRERDDYETYRQTLRRQYDGHALAIQREYDEYRSQINAEYAEHVKRVWKGVPRKPKLTLPPDPEPLPQPIFEDVEPYKDDKRVVIDTVVSPPQPSPRPEPVVPVNPKPFVDIPRASFLYYGTSVNVNGSAIIKALKMRGTSEDDVSAAWTRLSVKENDAFIASCIECREKLRLCDWGYFKFVDKALSCYLESGSREHVVAMGYILAQSGYSIRFCRDVSNKLYLLFACDGYMFDRGSYSIGGKDYYAYNIDMPAYVFISDTGFVGEKPFSFWINNLPALSFAAGNTRELIVKNYPAVKLRCTPNKNLIDFYQDYPNGTFDKSSYSRWAIQGNTPASSEMVKYIYPPLKEYITGLNQHDAVNFLLKVAQSFDYGFDNEIWGCDRTFWPDESWHYPLSDCEDHAIHFTRMIRDLLGLDAVLIYYPGHLSAAVAVTDGSLAGDVVVYNGHKYVVCDATYFYAPAGRTAPSNNNATAVLIPLRR